MIDASIQAAATKLSRRLKKGNFTLTVAESCTGGLLSSTLTDIAGASSWFKRSYVTYANEAKVEELGVDPKELATKGAVSAQVAIQMANGALKRSGADLAISITGIAGPTNEGSSKPVGTVYVGIASKQWANAKRTQIGGSRAENKIGFVQFAILTAMQSWDDAMVMLAEREKKEIDEIESAKRQRSEREAQQEAARKKREEDARAKAPWQDEAWNGTTISRKKGLEVEWKDSEE